MDQADWLAQVSEDIIDPERPICDPHHHLWDRPNRRYLFDELIADTGSGHNIVSTVFVECASMYRADGAEALRPVGETEFVNGVAAMSASGGYGAMRACAGIVSYADLTLGTAAGEVLDAHIAASPRFRGIRHAAGWDASDAVRNSHTNPSQRLLADPAFREGFAELDRRGLSFDAWLYHHQIPELTDLARAFPSTTIIFDHFGGPLGIGPYAGQRETIFAQWRKDVAELARCENVYAKLGGLVMPINGFGFHKRERPATSDELVAATGRYYRHAIDCFGPRRCMFESNFPVDKASCSYAVLWNAFKKLVADASETEKAWLFHDAAATAYRLDGASATAE
ncbi:MAG: amidohydrolase family protein [Gammaproteobacteria bacterium]|nr:amidohydrolase family protein [Gammaproteobacteria bacterium]MYK83690.1 amidohydrolase family protein [Gammaproteobacteria bacterium]